MKTIRLCNYLPRWGDGHAIDNIIDVWTHIWNPRVPDVLRCSHSELWLPNDLHQFKNDDGLYAGTCHTSTMRGKNINGVVTRPASDVFKHPERWTYINITVSNEEYTAIKNFCLYRASLGLKYGTATLFTFFWYRRSFNPDSPICSGECWYCLSMCCDSRSAKLSNVLSSLWCPSPTRLAYNICCKSEDNLHRLTDDKLLLVTPMR